MISCAGSPVLEELTLTPESSVTASQVTLESLSRGKTQHSADSRVDSESLRVTLESLRVVLHIRREVEKPTTPESL